MSSLWEWLERKMAEHDAVRPFAPENGQPLKFKIGDVVDYTNDSGVIFRHTVTGFYNRPSEPCSLYANGARYMLDWSCHWYPARESRLKLAE